MFPYGPSENLKRLLCGMFIANNARFAFPIATPYRGNRMGVIAVMRRFMTFLPTEEAGFMLPGIE
jgi:hypothetical protein